MKFVRPHVVVGDPANVEIVGISELGLPTLVDALANQRGEWKNLTFPYDGATILCWEYLGYLYSVGLQDGDNVLYRIEQLGRMEYDQDGNVVIEDFRPKRQIEKYGEGWGMY
jgi:hypothetical protein